jgi:hypothetical protein
MGRALGLIPQELFFLVGLTPEPVLIIFARGLLDKKADESNSAVGSRVFSTEVRKILGYQPQPPARGISSDEICTWSYWAT